MKPTKNVSGTFLSSVDASVTINTAKAGLRMTQFAMRYGYCVSGECRTLNIPIESVVGKGLSYKITSSKFNSPVYVIYPESETPATISVLAYPYYATGYVSGPKTASVKADIRKVSAMGATFKTVSYGYNNQKYSYETMHFGSIPVKTGLAYGNWLRVIRSYGYGY